MLPAPPESAWRFIEERGNEIELLTFEPQGEQGCGVLNHITMKILGLPVRAVSRTMIWDPPSTCAFESVKPSWPVTTRITEMFRPSGGLTEHVIEYEVDGRGAIGSVVAPIFCRMMRRNRRLYQERLRAALARENSHHQPAAKPRGVVD